MSVRRDGGRLQSRTSSRVGPQVPPQPPSLVEQASGKVSSVGRAGLSLLSHRIREAMAVPEPEGPGPGRLRRRDTDYSSADELGVEALSDVQSLDGQESPCASPRSLLSTRNDDARSGITRQATNEPISSYTQCWSDGELLKDMTDEQRSVMKWLDRGTPAGHSQHEGLGTSSDEEEKVKIRNMADGGVVSSLSGGGADGSADSTAVYRQPQVKPRTGGME